MSLIERYLEAVKRYLPEGIREDVGMELQANIEDMLPDNYTEKDVYQVLIKLGSPRILANEYNPQKRYLIGPTYYDKYISVLKKVIGICVFVSLSLAFLGWIIEPSIHWYGISNIGKLIGSMIASSITGALQGAFWVTLLFSLIERSEIEVGYIPRQNKEWTPDDLPELGNNEKKKISRRNTVISMFLTIFFTAIIYFYPQLIAFYSLGENNNVIVTPLFNLQRLQGYIPFILILAALQFVIFVWKYIVESWNKSLSIANAAYNFAVCTLVVVMLCDKLLINEEIISTLATYTKASIFTFSKELINVKWILGVVLIGIYLLDSIRSLVKGVR